MQSAVTGARSKVVIIMIACLIIGIISFFYLRYSPSSLLIEMKVSQSGYGQVFWDIGNGYSEQQSVKFRLDSSPKAAIYVVALPASELKSVRIDPMQSTGSFEITRLRLEGANGFRQELVAEKLREDLRLLHNVIINGDGDIAGGFFGKAITPDPAVEISNIPAGLSKNSVSKRTKLAFAYFAGSLIFLLSLSRIPAILQNDKIQNVQEKTWMFVLALMVFLGNLQIYWVQVLFRDDNEWFYYWSKAGSLPLINTYNISYANYLNHVFLWVATAVNLYLGRTLVLVGIFIPLALLLFRVLRKLEYPLPVAFFTAGLICFFPGEVGGPIFVNGAYTAEALLFVMISVWSGMKFLEADDGFKTGWFMLCLLTFYWSLNVSELVVSIAAPLIFCFLCWRSFEKKAWVLSISIGLLTAYYGYFHILHRSRFVVKMAKPLSLESMSGILGQLLNWSLPTPFFSQPHDYKWTIVVAVISGSGLLLRLSNKSDSSIDTPSTPPNSQKRQFIWRAIFPGMFCLLPVIMMSMAPWYATRHALFSVIGLYLFISYTTYEGFSRYTKKAATFCMMIVFLGYMFLHYKNIYDFYAPKNSEHVDFIKFATQQNYPHNSQLVVANMGENTTSGHYSWSSGYLKHFLQREDINGLIGNEPMLANPFKPLSAGKEVTGLNLREPVFLYRLESGTFKQLKYCLTWEDNRSDSTFTIYRVDPLSGKMTSLSKGEGLAELSAATAGLAKEGVTRSDIMWGGEPSGSDRQRLGL